MRPASIAARFGLALASAVVATAGLFAAVNQHPEEIYLNVGNGTPAADAPARP